MEREKFGSRLGFILIAAGCAIGLGNVWKFPYIVGAYGGATFVLIYLFFLFALGLPIMVMEFAVGRASRKSIARSFHDLEPKDSKWHWYSMFGMAGNYLLMMFYTTVAGWMLIYLWKTASGQLNGLSADAIAGDFVGMLGDPVMMGVAMVIATVLGMAVCLGGVQNGVEKITKPMMLCLLALLVILAIRSITLDGAAEGLAFYLVPNWAIFETVSINEVVFAAMGQAFFTLSLGIGSMAIFGSYIDKDRSLTSEAISVTLLDTFVAFTAGLIIFPACFAFGVSPDSGPQLLFITLPNVFNAMPAGQLWGTLFFVFMSFAAMSTVIGVFENIISCCMDGFGWDRKKSVTINLIALLILAVPCVLGYNIWSGFEPLGDGTAVLDLEDFFVSFNLLPIGSVIYLLFCTSRYGWGWENFIAEADQGKGMKFPKALRFYMTYIIPILVLYVFIMGYKSLFFS
ncbi:sodium-dependent transporter [Bengtsoniella intestinalis]|uniref:sodium-dependent transporter n=1 Tax=Bengtsoniella intestinalis TaxID=3073143 RepID=UPI00391F884E